MRPRRKWLILLPPPVDAEAVTAAGRGHRLRVAAFAPTANSTTVRFDRRMDLIVDDGVLLVAGRRK